jgi:hypothetical protein
MILSVLSILKSLTARPPKADISFPRNDEDWIDVHVDCSKRKGGSQAARTAETMAQALAELIQTNNQAEGNANPNESNLRDSQPNSWDASVSVSALTLDLPGVNTPGINGNRISIAANLDQDRATETMEWVTPNHAVFNRCAIETRARKRQYMPTRGPKDRLSFADRYLRRLALGTIKNESKKTRWDACYLPKRLKNSVKFGSTAAPRGLRGDGNFLRCLNARMDTMGPRDSLGVKGRLNE